MTKLSPKAFRFVDAAVIRSQDEEIRAIWNGFKRERAQELSDEVARAVLRALRESERDLGSRLELTSVSEDEAADLSNDLGLIRAIKRDLHRQVGRDAK
jgi:hypothetical protein